MKIKQIVGRKQHIKIATFEVPCFLIVLVWQLHDVVPYDAPFCLAETPVPLEEKRGTPLPPIGQAWQTVDDDKDKPDVIQLPNCPIVMAMGKKCW